MVWEVIMLEKSSDIFNIFGNFDSNIKIIEKEYNVSIINRDLEIKIYGEQGDADKAKRVIMSLVSLSDNGQIVSEQSVRYTMSMVEDGLEKEIVKLNGDCICISAKGRAIKPKTVGQRKYIELIQKNTIVLGVGPAGTGKTYLAVAMAVSALRNKEVMKIILTRPAVEAGEKLGFLPGDLQQKVDPYLRPLYDALFDMLGAETHQKYIEKGIIEVAPLAYMRGRTLDDSFIILDEAQNATKEQMKMFLTRLGFNSKAIITGDITQIDLGFNKKSGLVDAISVLKNIDDIGICQLTHKDVVRHQLVQKIIKAYEKQEKPEKSEVRNKRIRGKKA